MPSNSREQVETLNQSLEVVTDTGQQREASACYAPGGHSSPGRAPMGQIEDPWTMLPHIRLNFQHSSPPSHTYTSPTWVLLFTFFYPSLLCYTPQGNSPPFPPPSAIFFPPFSFLLLVPLRRLMVPSLLEPSDQLPGPPPRVNCSSELCPQTCPF